MSDNKPLMPLATAVWLVDNTALSFSQISRFCQLHELEVQSIADGEDAYRMQGLNPIASGQLTMDEIKRCEGDHTQELQLQNKKSESIQFSVKTKKYLPLSVRANPLACLSKSFIFRSLSNDCICLLITD